MKVPNEETLAPEVLKERILKKLPTFPKIIQEAWELMQKPNVSPEAISEVIGKDIALTAKVLRLVNSPFYGFPNRIASLKHAIVLLGLNTIRGLLISTVVFGEITPALMQIWEHACECATTAGIIARRLESKASDEMIVAGLLHDMSKAFLKVHLPDLDVQIEAVKKRDKCIDSVAEKRILGINHEVINLWMAEKWHFPVSLKEALAYHHQVSKAKEHPQFAAVVNLADVLVHIYRLKPGKEVIPEVNTESCKILNLSPEFLLEVIADMDKSLYASDWGEL